MIQARLPARCGRAFTGLWPLNAGCVLYSDGFTDSERLRATGKLVARSLSEAVELIYV